MAKSDGADDGAKAAKPKISRKTMIIAGVAGLALIGGGAGAYVMLAGGGESGEHGEAAAKDDGHGGGKSGGHGEAASSGHGAAAAASGTAFVELPEMTINLASADPARMQYVRMTVALEVSSPELVSAIKPLMPRVVDSFQTHLREMRPSDLRGSAGVYRLKEELLRRVNVAIAPAKADAVLFKDMVVQ